MDTRSYPFQVNDVKPLKLTAMRVWLYTWGVQQFSRQVLKDEQGARVAEGLDEDSWTEKNRKEEKNPELSTHMLHVSNSYLLWA